MTTATGRRVRVRVTGTVQGVGFRPYVYRLASELELSGWVLNDSRGVMAEVEADSGAVERFLERLPAEAPPLSQVELVVSEELAPTGARGFAIHESPRAGEPNALVSPDMTTCDDCLRELFDPGDRRYRYPFTNCTNCGPRFTIVRGVPYDRPYTTMARFEMCSACRAEYEDPTDRRFHAQPNACPVCGPRVELRANGGATDGAGDARDAVAAAARALMRGAIVAIKGVGGFHLACRAGDEAAVAALRARKRREDKPFAMMAPSLEHARGLVALTAAEEELLVSRERPIVLARRQPHADVAAAVAPRSRDFGVMLPYSPLHHLLLADAASTLVMTSGNVSDEPIAFDDDDALARLAPIADLFLLHDRPIQTRTDDSVVRAVMVGSRVRPLVARRSRGFVPANTPLPLVTTRPLLACGAELKNTFCVAKDDHAWVGHHIGDLKNWETLRSFREGVGHFTRLFAVEPEVVAHDLHPDYLSTRYAQNLDGVELVGVQHHHAHLAACLAEHGEVGPAVGAIFDGTGYGTDGTVWGGELLYGDLAEFERVGSLMPVRMPGGEAVIVQPWRMACAWLDASGANVDAVPAAFEGLVDAGAWTAVVKLARSGLASPVTTSVGRLFDAVAAVCGVCDEVRYEGQAAIELEAASDPDESRAYRMPVTVGGKPLTLDPVPMLRALVADLASGTEAGVVAARFHSGLAQATAHACRLVAGRRGCRSVVLSGGVFQNVRLLEHTARLLEGSGLRVLTPERLPPGDGGIAYGQAVVAAARLARAA